ncbi:hypothetical protein TNCT_367701 [Trichonephila clavata]|uniref:Uncharacterized protein n=1 Tax=Trichonephila clavata TaxID=2740835 RepID=A0A8X6GTN1_TRICU|nr:hypothetical protein TNCT_367701 [Trichonephila clavata]
MSISFMSPYLGSWPTEEAVGGGGILHKRSVPTRGWYELQPGVGLESRWGDLRARGAPRGKGFRLRDARHTSSHVGQPGGRGTVLVWRARPRAQCRRSGQGVILRQGLPTSSTSFE